MIAKAIRSQAKERFDIRVLMSSPSRAEWYGKASTSKESVGGYEVRLKGWDEVLKRARNMSRGDWESRTVYMVCVSPFPYSILIYVCP